MLWRFLCNVWHLLFIVWTYILRMLIVKLVDAANLWIYHDAEYEFAVVTVVHLSISETLNVAPCSLMGASRRFERLCCLHIQGPKGPRRYGRNGILQCKDVTFSFSVPQRINVFADCHVTPCAIDLASRCTKSRRLLQSRAFRVFSFCSYCHLEPAYSRAAPRRAAPTANKHSDYAVCNITVRC